VYLEIECIECGTVKQITPGRGRPRYYCEDKCRHLANAKLKKNPELIREYESKKRLIRVLYRDYRSSSMSIAGLQKSAIRVLSANEWSYGNIGKLLGMTDERVRQLSGLPRK
jgi:hypothetical protein